MATIAEKLGLVVGEPAYFSDAYNRVKRGKVKRITPSGQVVVEVTQITSPNYEVRFSVRGDELNPSSRWRVGHLISKESFDAQKAHDTRKAVKTALENNLNAAVKLGVDNSELPAKLEALASVIREYQASGK